MDCIRKFNNMSTLYICLFVFVAELGHAVAHLSVLFGWGSISTMSGSYRKVYFGCDLISNLIVWVLDPGQFWFLRFLHFVIHFGATCHLFGYHQPFFQHVFELAENSSCSPKPVAVWRIYMLGTLLDIYTHFVNGYRLCILIAATMITG